MATKAEILQSLSDEQRDIVINYNGKLAVEAIPGSGKSSTIVARIQYMIKDGIAPSRILAFTFTKKAANELKERVRAKIGADADKITICTYHSFCNKLLRIFPEYTGRNRNFIVYDEDDRKSIIEKLRKSFLGDKNASPSYGTVIGYIDRFRDNNITPSEALRRCNKETPSWEKLSARIYEAYEKQLLKCNAFD